jgi:hypothetical protein
MKRKNRGLTLKTERLKRWPSNSTESTNIVLNCEDHDRTRAEADQHEDRKLQPRPHRTRQKFNVRRAHTAGWKMAAVGV